MADETALEITNDRIEELNAQKDAVERVFHYQQENENQQKIDPQKLDKLLENPIENTGAFDEYFAYLKGQKRDSKGNVTDPMALEIEQKLRNAALSVMNDFVKADQYYDRSYAMYPEATVDQLREANTYFSEKIQDLNKEGGKTVTDYRGEEGPIQRPVSLAEDRLDAQKDALEKFENAQKQYAEYLQAENKYQAILKNKTFKDMAGDYKKYSNEKRAAVDPAFVEYFDNLEKSKGTGKEAEKAKKNMKVFEKDFYNKTGLDLSQKSPRFGIESEFLMNPELKKEVYMRQAHRHLDRSNGLAGSSSHADDLRVPQNVRTNMEKWASLYVENKREEALNYFEAQGKEVKGSEKRSAGLTDQGMAEMKDAATKCGASNDYYIQTYNHLCAQQYDQVVYGGDSWRSTEGADTNYVAGSMLETQAYVKSPALLTGRIICERDRETFFNLAACQNLKGTQTEIMNDISQGYASLKNIKPEDVKKYGEFLVRQSVDENLLTTEEKEYMAKLKKDCPGIDKLEQTAKEYTQLKSADSPTAEEGRRMQEIEKQCPFAKEYFAERGKTKNAVDEYKQLLSLKQENLKEEETKRMAELEGQYPCLAQVKETTRKNQAYLAQMREKVSLKNGAGEALAKETSSQTTSRTVDPKVILAARMKGNEY